MAKRKSRSKKAANKGAGCLVLIAVIIAAAVGSGGDDNGRSSSRNSSSRQSVSTSVHVSSATARPSTQSEAIQPTNTQRATNAPVEEATESPNTPDPNPTSIPAQSSSGGNSQTTTNSEGTLIRTINPTTYYASNGVNLRTCASTSCSVAGQVSAGTGLTAVAIYEGQTVNAGNSEWYEVTLGNGVAYVYSGVVTTQQPVVSVPFSGSGVNNSTTNNSNNTPPTSAPVQSAVCDCSGDNLNCSNFNTQVSAQACHNHCMATVGYDINGLDGNNNNGLACESLP